MATDNSVAGVVAGSWKWVLAFGIVLVLVGMLAIANPFATVIATSLLLAIGLLIAGAFSLLFMLPGTAFIVLAFVVGIGFIIRGAFLSVIGLRLKRLVTS